MPRLTSREIQYAVIVRSMAPKSDAGTVDPTKEKWVTTTWIPHTTLSQTSHVSLTIRSAHVVLDTLSYPVDDNLPEWRIRIGVFGVAGLPIVPLHVHTTAAPVRKCAGEVPSSSRVVLSQATHDCQWDTFVHIPIRWRDLPRDGYLAFEVLSHGENAVYYTKMPFFNRYGKLKGGLQRLGLSSVPLNTHQNHGLVGCSSEEKDAQDPVWQAILLLDELERMEDRARANLATADTFGQTPCVPWLDNLEKERSKKVISEALEQKNVRKQLVRFIAMLTIFTH